jgi:hypothetical protein
MQDEIVKGTGKLLPDAKLCSVKSRQCVPLL